MLAQDLLYPELTRCLLSHLLHPLHPYTLELWACGTGELKAGVIFVKNLTRLKIDSLIQGLDFGIDSLQFC